MKKSVTGAPYVTVTHRDRWTHGHRWTDDTQMDTIVKSTMTETNCPKQQRQQHKTFIKLMTVL